MLRYTARAAYDIMFIHVILPRGVVQLLAGATESSIAAIAETGGSECPFQDDIRHSESLGLPARPPYTRPRLVEASSALGLFIESSAFGRGLGNIDVRVAQPDAPKQLLVAETGAQSWLADYVQ